MVMKKIQCPNLEKGENVHTHYCQCCKGSQHIPFAVALRYQLSWLLVLHNGKDASDEEMHYRIRNYIEFYKDEHGYTGKIEFERFEYGEPISTLNACIDSLRFHK